MWFQRLGGNYQLILESAADLEHLWSLEEARWIASSAPTSALNVDPSFLGYLDSDSNGRIRIDELKLGVRWTLNLLSERAALGSDVLRLEAIDDGAPEGRALKAAARQILTNLGRPEAQEIDLAAIRDRKRIMADAATNGDGILPAMIFQDEEIRAFVEAALQTVGAEQDASGRQGLTEPLMDRFLDEGRRWLTWRAAGAPFEVKPGGPPPTLGADPEAALAAIEAIEAKLDAWFALCQLSRLDPAALGLHRMGDGERAALAQREESAILERLRSSPLAEPTPTAALDPEGWLNPAWSAEIAALRATAWSGEEPLTAEGWSSLKTRYRSYRAWRASRPATKADQLDPALLRSWVEEPRFADEVRAHAARDRAVANELARVADVEKLALYQRWILEFANNFVNFSRFYDPSVRSMLEMGTLVMDGRDFNLTVRVEDVAAHKTRAKNGMIYLLYVKVLGRAPEPDLTVAAAVTSMDRGSLFVGKRGVFRTTKDEIRDAVVVDILENPISVWEAIKQPFIRLGAFLTAQVEALNKKQYEALEGRVGAGFQSTAAEISAVPTELPEPTPEPAPEPAAEAPADDSLADPSTTRALLVNGGIAVAAVSSALAYIANTLASIDITQLVVALAVLTGLVTLPAVALAMYRLSQRDLAVVLEASGWAINHELRLPRWAGPVFTRTPPLPDRARRKRPELLRAFRALVEVDDDPGRPWLTAAAVAAIFFLLAAWRMGLLG